jgi:hypothetical protein
VVAPAPSAVVCARALRVQFVLFDSARAAPALEASDAAPGELVPTVAEPKAAVPSAALRAVAPDRSEALVAWEFHGHVAAAGPDRGVQERSVSDAARVFAVPKAVAQAK